MGFKVLARYYGNVCEIEDGVLSVKMFEIKGKPETFYAEFDLDKIIPTEQRKLLLPGACFRVEVKQSRVIFRVYVGKKLTRRKLLRARKKANRLYGKMFEYFKQD